MCNGLIRLITITSLALAGTLGLGFAARAQAPSPSSGGKEPDILGIRTGMTPQEVYERLKEIDPTHRVTVGQVLVPSVLGNQPAVYGMSPEALSNGSEIISVAITVPPNPQQVWSIFRQTPRIHTTLDQILASLRQKYGQESAGQGGGVSWGLTWVYDEQGQLASPSIAAVKLHDCGNAFSPITVGSLPNSTTPPQAGVSPPPIVDPITVSQYQDPTKNLPCQGWVLVQASIGGDLQNGFGLSLTITNANIEKRAALALSNALKSVAAKQQQKQLDNARKQSVPVL